MKRTKLILGIFLGVLIQTLCQQYKVKELENSYVEVCQENGELRSQKLMWLRLDRNRGYKER